MIYLECTDSQIENYLTPTISNPSITFIHKDGILRLTMDHDRMNALRAIMMFADDSPQSLLIKDPQKMTHWTYSADNVSIDYQGYGSMKYESSGMRVTTNAVIKTNDIVLNTSIYHFDVSPYEHEDYNDPPYYYYVGATQVGIHLDKSQLEKAVGLLNKVFPYERFASINMPAYNYIKGGK